MEDGGEGIQTTDILNNLQGSRNEYSRHNCKAARHNSRTSSVGFDTAALLRYASIHKTLCANTVARSTGTPYQRFC